MISSLLVANRGEIARRIFRSCRVAGIGTIAVFSDPDAESPHVAEADARAPQVAAPWVGWDNQQVGGARWPYARLGRGRRMHLLETPHGEVACETGTSEGSGVGQNEDGTRSRGDTIGGSRSL